MTQPIHTPDTDLPPLLEIQDLATTFETPGGIVRAVDGVGLTVEKGRTLCIVGESGCGKSATARSVLNLIERPGKIVGGEVHWRGGTAAGANRGTRRDLLKLDARGEEMRRVRGLEIAMVFQEPTASLSPMFTIGEHLSEVLEIHMGKSRSEARSIGIELLRKVGIARPEDRIDAYSFQLSGGMCQRAMIALALACEPELLIADEPTTALDVTTQARILDLLRALQAETGLALLFITHDLGVVAEIADNVAVMYLGRIVESGTVDQIFHEPKHPYTQALLRSVPRVGVGRKQRLQSIRGNVPHPTSRPAGCSFHPRCDMAIAGVCDTRPPPTVQLARSRHVECVLYAEETGKPGETP